MRLRTPFALICLLSLGGCSYGYDVIATVIDGRLAFVVGPKSQRSPSCINAIEIIAFGGARAKASPGDDASRIAHGTFRYDRVGYDCVDRFPIFYGTPLTGPALPADQRLGSVAAKRLRIGVVYEIHTTSGATGYGGGAFKILPDRRVVNVPEADIRDLADNLTDAASNAD